MRIAPLASYVTGLLATCVVAACSPEDSPETRVRAVIEAAEQAAEARDVAAAMRLVARDYTDSRGFDREELRRFLQGYFVLNQSIRLLVRIEDVQFPADELAQARVTVGTLGTRGEETEDWSVAVDLHEFDVELVREGGDWLLRRAEWSASQ